MKMEVETGFMQPKAKECLEPPETGRNDGKVSLRAFGGKMALLTPYFGLSASRTLIE